MNLYETEMESMISGKAADCSTYYISQRIGFWAPSHQDFPRFTPGLKTLFHDQTPAPKPQTLKSPNTL